MLYNGDIEALAPSQLTNTHFSANKRCDLLLGGPPCQGFSTHRICDAGVDDPRNELIHTYFEFVKALNPRIFLMENVPGILWERHKEYLDQFYRECHDAGYTLFEPVTMDARDFGVPQRRKRVIILGLEPGLSVENFKWPPDPTHANPATISENDDLEPWVSCAKIFEEPDDDVSNNCHMNHGIELTRAFENTPLNGGSRKDSGRVLTCHKRHDGHKDVYGRINPAHPAPTMTTACINPSKGRFVHPTEHHGITARQAARIQTFPDDYVFYGGLIALGKKIGNAVPVALGRTIIEHISTYLLGQDVCVTDSETKINQLSECA